MVTAFWRNIEEEYIEEEMFALREHDYVVVLGHCVMKPAG